MPFFLLYLSMKCTFLNIEILKFFTNSSHSSPVQWQPGWLSPQLPAGHYLYIYTFECLRRKVRKTTEKGQFCGLESQAMSPRKEKRRPGNIVLKMIGDATICELYFVLEKPDFSLFIVSCGLFIVFN